MQQQPDRDPYTPDANRSGVSLDALRQAVDDNAKLVRTIYTAFLGFCLYIAVLAGSTTHEQLLSDKAPKIPLVDIELPIVGIYLVTPLLLLLFHFNLLLQMYFLARTSWQFKGRLDQENLPTDKKSDHLDILNSSPFVYMLIGEHFGGIIRFLIRTMIGLTVFCAPLLLLLSLQSAFLPYHHAWLHDLHIAVIIVDSVIVLFFWSLYYNSPHDLAEGASSKYQSVVAQFLTLRKTDRKKAFNILAWGFVPSVPDIGWIFLTGWISYAVVKALAITPTLLLYTAILFGAYALITGITISFANHGRGIVRLAFCTVVILLSTLGPYRPFNGCGDHFFSSFANDPFWGTAEDSRDYLVGKRPWPAVNKPCYYAGERLADMLSYLSPKLNVRQNKVEFRTIAKSFYKNLPLISDIRPPRVIEYHGSILKIVETEIQDGAKKSTRKENLGVDLASRDLRGANLSSAILYKADLQKANLEFADLRNAVLHSAKLQGATLHQANLHDAELQGANLTNARAHGAIFAGAKLHAANLTGAKLIGANFAAAEFYGTRADRGDFTAATLTRVKLYGADLGSADLKLTNFSDAEVYETKILRYAIRLNSDRAPGSDISGLKMAALTETEMKAVVALVQPYDNSFSLEKKGLRCIEKGTGIDFSRITPSTPLLFCPQDIDDGNLRLERWKHLISAFPKSGGEQADTTICSSVAIRQILLSEFDERILRFSSLISRFLIANPKSRSALRDFVLPFITAIRAADPERCMGAAHYRLQNSRELLHIEQTIQKLVDPS
jgi:uncharacterized protein YjbI with pentapeptide repeats